MLIDCWAIVDQLSIFVRLGQNRPKIAICGFDGAGDKHCVIFAKYSIDWWEIDWQIVNFVISYQIELKIGKQGFSVSLTTNLVLGILTSTDQSILINCQFLTLSQNRLKKVYAVLDDADHS